MPFHYELIKEAVESLGEAKPRQIIDFIKEKHPDINVNESSFNSDIIGCSVNHSSSSWYDMPKFLYFDKVKKTYKMASEKSVKVPLNMQQTKPSINDFQVTDDHIAIARKILDEYKNKKGMFKEYSSLAIDEDIDSSIYLDYITLTSAIDYQKNIQANDLWRASKNWAARYPWLYKPKELLNKSTHETFLAFESIRQKDGRFLRIPDMGIWLSVSKALYSFGGTTFDLLHAYQFDAYQIFTDLSNPRKKEFPYLSGPKILPMWLKILAEDAEQPLKNMDLLPLPVDKNVAEVTCNLFLNKPFTGEVSEELKIEVQNAWNQVATKLKTPVINFDSALWVLGGSNGCSDRQRSSCYMCPGNKYCHQLKKR